ncbi:MAG: hypothetical protein M4579_003933 [Chaenotheca gracillima]|nr:MAG: hypothetical protein M4579_003933 [Chaenotheca gracillima]
MDIEKTEVIHAETGSEEVLGIVDTAAEKKLVWKCDLHIIPPLFVLYMLAFLDRVNIGNARIQGLEKELGMEGNDYNVALLVFFVPYVLFEVPSNLILKNVAPSTWLTSIMALWGIATIGQGLVRNYAGLVACRVLLGLFEAGFFPGCVYLISMYYKRYELQWRLNLFFCSSILAGAFGGLLAFALAHMEGVGGYSGWRWIFIIEGVLTVVVAIIAWFFVVDWPETSKFLTDADRELLLQRLATDVGVAKMNRLDKNAGKRISKDWKIYVGTLMYFGVVNTGYSTSFFLPTILTELGYTAAGAQVRSIPIFVAASLLSLIVAIFTDRLHHRYAFCILGLVIASIGYIMLLAQGHLAPGVKYFATYLITCGGYITQPVCIAWLNNNTGGHYKRAVSSAVQIGFGNLGGIVASNIFLTTEAPRYPTGYGTALGLLGLCAVSCTVMLVGVIIENRKRDRGERDYRYQLPPEELSNIGDDHPEVRLST